MSPLSIAAMTEVPDKAEESVRSGWGELFLVAGGDETQKLAI